MRHAFRATIALLAITVSGLLLGACGESVDRSGTVDLLVEEGYTQAQAECFVDGAVDELGEDRLLEVERESGEFTSGEQAILERIQVECLTAGTGEPDDAE